MQKRGSWVTFSTFWICWCFDDPRTQKLPLRSVPACAGVIQTGDLIPAGKANRRASENKQRKSSKAWLSRAGPGQPWAEHSPLFQPCLWKSAQIWAGSRAEIAPNSCYELNTVQRLRLAGEQKPNPGHWDIEGEEKKKKDQIQLIKHSNQSGAERSFHFTWLYVMSLGSLFFYPNMET